MNRFPVLVVGDDVATQMAPHARDWQIGGQWSRLLQVASDNLEDEGVDSAPVRRLVDVPPVYAIVRDGTWESRDTMNWPGAEHTGTEVWIAHVGRLMNALDPDTLLTVVDCHT